MATTRAIIYFIRRRHLLPCTGSTLLQKTNFHFPLCVPHANYADQKAITKSENESNSQVSTKVTFTESVKENTKSAWYLTVIIAGVGVTAVMFYAIFRELFSSNSPNSIYAKAVERCLKDPKVTDAVGLPCKAYGEETRRGRRGHVSHTVYTNEKGDKFMRMKFYIQGSRKNGTVNLEMKEDLNGDWMYRYLFVQLKDRPRSVIILEDNRSVENNVIRSAEEAHELVPPGFRL